MNKLTIRIIYYTLGSIILSFGISISIISQIGAGAFDALNSNLSHLLDITMGNAMYISIFLVYILTMLLKPKKIYVVGLFLTFFVGFGIDMWQQVIPNINYNLTTRIFFFISSLVILPLGVTFIIKSQMPLSPMDNLLVILVDKTSWNVAIIKTLIEGSFAVLALIYGLSANIGVGAISIGTIIITFAIGPGINFFMKYVKDIDIKKEVRPEDGNKTVTY